MTEESKGVVLVVDDDPHVLTAVSMLLNSKGYTAISCQDSRRAVRMMVEAGVDIVLSDIKMPNITGIELLKKIHEISPEMPVILMTAYADLEVALDAIRQGAFDMVIKPYNSDYLIFTIDKAIRYETVIKMEKHYKQILEETVEKRTAELAEALNSVKVSSIETIKRLTLVAEFRDTDTGTHILRIGNYAKMLAEAMHMSPDFVEAISFTSMMHDIGKIGIPDSILLKKGPLDQDEIEIMKTHTNIGHRMLSGSSHYNLQMAASIALNHHERWDGYGYPYGLKGEDIPIEGRITMICDVYDSLRSERPYKPAFEHEKAVRIITEGDGRTMPYHFCPEVLKAFKENVSAFEEIFNASVDYQI